MKMDEKDYELLTSKNGSYMIKFYKNPKLGFDFDFQIYVPENIRPDANILLSFSKEFDGRSEAIAESVKAPIMITDVKNGVDSNGNEINFKQFEMSAVVDKDGNKVCYSDKNTPTNEQCNTSIIEQYKMAIEAAYKVLKDTQVISKDKEEKIDIEGYSYHGVRAQRLALLIPESTRSVFCGGAISSIPIPMKEVNGVELTYPTGIAGMEKIVGEENIETLVEEYKKVIQVVFATEQELKYDGNFSIDGTRVRDMDGNKTDHTKITVSQHDISPEVVDTVVTQINLFGTDINDRIDATKRLVQSAGCEIKTKIYPNIDHHFAGSEETFLSDISLAIGSMDQVEQGKKIEASKLRGFDRGVERIDTSYESKRREIQEKLIEAENEEEYNDILESIVIEMAQNPEESEKFLFNEAKGFVKEITPEMIKSAKSQSTLISINHLARKALEQGIADSEIDITDKEANSKTKDNQIEGVSLDEQ